MKNTFTSLIFGTRIPKQDLYVHGLLIFSNQYSQFTWPINCILIFVDIKHTLYIIHIVDFSPQILDK